MASKYIVYSLLILLLAIGIMCVVSLIVKLIFKVKIKKVVLGVVAATSFIISLIVAASIYLNNYNHADASVEKYLISNEEVSVTKIDSGYYFDGKGEKDLIIFYPGAKVEATAYAPLLYQLAQKGYDSVLIEMPFNIAILGKNKADNIINNYSYENYYLSGHSLGGAMASIYVNEHDNIKGLILLASYSTKEIDIPVLSIYGSRDGVLKLDAYKGYKDNLKNVEEHIIEGANHSGFAYYNTQSDDNISFITIDNQIDITINYIDNFINKR